ncbi:hypothetical protein EAH81_05400 [Flavobacterium pectinovorum]|uniref:Uncharacterized protein n=2 Tax=Flavobacterium pectinovorum TaxID=29533 RepID=A0A502F5U4_9FLAO|nr:hypothetical protein EAH81_05400 [Flavobacterium pectinovorum]
MHNYFDDRNNLNKSVPILLIENQERYGEHFSTEITNLRFEYLQEIVESLEKVLSGELQYYDFGYEVYSIECKKEIAQVIDTYNYWKCIAEIPTQAIYLLLKDWRDYLISNPVITESKDVAKDLEIPFNYIFFDGINLLEVTGSYDNWLSSDDYAVYSNSYVEIREKRIYIFKENVKTLSTFRYFSKQELELLTKKHNLKIKQRDDCFYAYDDNYISRTLEISQNDQLTVIYCLTGSYGPEGIFIYAVFENQKEMKLIEQFYCIQTEIFGNGSKNINESIASIKTELIRPDIKILDPNGNNLSSERKTYRKQITARPSEYSQESFIIDELLFLSKTYGFEIEEHAIYKGYYTSVLKIHKLYDCPGEIILIEHQGKQYIMIEFKRWQFEYQPRGAGEDSYGEDVTYVLGIWENPLLTDEIITKIKLKR